MAPTKKTPASVEGKTANKKTAKATKPASKKPVVAKVKKTVAPKTEAKAVVAKVATKPVTVKKTATKSTKRSDKYFYGVGRRKRSTVRAKYYPTAKEISIVVDGIEASVRFPKYYHQLLENMLTQVGVRTGDIELFPRGGGVSGQAEASRLAISKALLAHNEGLRPVLRAHGYLTTDVRIVLMKRPGKRKARKSEQWSKR